MNVKYKRSSTLSNKEYRKKMEEQIHEVLRNDIPSVYASIALALFRDYDWDYDMIEELFGKSERIWQELSDKDVDMIDYCYNETKILLRGE